MQQGAGGYSLSVTGAAPTALDMAAAEKLLARVLNDPNPAHLAIRSAYTVLGDGATVRVQVIGTQRSIAIDKPTTSGQPPVPTESALWVPQGFMAIPGDAASAQGYGLPLKLDSSGDPFAAANIDPGLDISRWTASGPCAQVLLTNVDTAVYPPRDKQLIPIAYNSTAWAPQRNSTIPTTAWHAVRARFNDFTWDAATSQIRQAYWKAIIADAATGFRLPFATHYDDAQWLAQMLDKYGSMSALPAWFAATTLRAKKDGIPLSYGDGYGTGTPTPAQVAAQIGTPTAGTWTAFDVGRGTPSLGLTTAIQAGWIESGTAYWHPGDPSLPTLSWLSYPAMNLPGYVTTAAFATIQNNVLPELESLGYEWRQSKQQALFGKNLYTMGRCIGTLPETVIAAGIAKVRHQDQTGAIKTYTQIRVITWAAADQPINSSVYNYMWQFNVWFVETLSDASVPLHLDELPVGAYDATNNPNGWQKSGSFVLQPGANPLDNLMRLIGQTWRFDPAGGKAVAYMQYTSTVGGAVSSTPLEVTFDNVSNGTLGASVARPSVPAMSAPYFTAIIAIDYASNGDLACLYQCSYPTSATLPLPPGAQSGYPPNAPDNLAGIAAKWFWSGGGDAEIAGWYGGSGAANTCPIIQLWALDARDGAFVMVNHWFNPPVTEGDPMTQTYYVRTCRAGSRLATDTFADTKLVEDFSNGYLVTLDVIKASYVRDQAGNWLCGYDFGVTKGETYIFSTAWYPNASLPSAALATASTWTTSHWMSNFGDPVAMAKTDPASTQLFPLGVV